MNNNGGYELKKIYYQVDKLQNLIMLLIVVMIINLNIIFHFDNDNPLYTMRFFIYIPALYFFILLLLDNYLMSYIIFDEYKNSIFIKLFFSKEKRLMDLSKTKKL